MKFIRKCPLFLLLISTGILFTILAAGGRGSIYKELEYHPLEAPFLSLLFVGLHDEIYPWQMLTPPAEETVNLAAAGGEDAASEKEFKEEQVTGEGETDTVQEASGTVSGGNAKGVSQGKEVSGNALDGGEDEKDEQGEEVTQAVMPSAAPAIPEDYSIAEGRLAPLRESTREEYLNHISADIYGDAGVIRAASYQFVGVDESYFDDALFIGDSRTVGLRDYTDLSEHADFLCETSLTIHKVLEEDFPQAGTVAEALAARDYGKIYIMVGINELGSGTTETYMAEYTKVIDTLHALEPDALIFIQGVMRVTESKNQSDAIFNNSNINARNNAVATLADNIQIFYIDVNEVVCDEQGNLNSDYTYDQIHLLGVYNDLWKQFLLSHGVILT